MQVFLVWGPASVSQVTHDVRRLQSEGSFTYLPSPKVGCNHESFGNLDHEELMPAYTIHTFPHRPPLYRFCYFFFKGGSLALPRQRKAELFCDQATKLKIQRFPCFVATVWLNSALNPRTSLGREELSCRGVTNGSTPGVKEQVLNLSIPVSN